VVLENVCGALHSHEGKDFAAIGSALSSADYRFGAVVMNAIHFLPQSRPRLFIVGIRADGEISHDLTLTEPDSKWHPESLVRAYEKLSLSSRAKWVLWKLPAAPKREGVFADVIEENPRGVEWHSPEETRRLLDMMSAVNLKKVEKAKGSGRRQVGGIYKRMRLDEAGRKVQRAEIRFDDVAGCLRTPVGGSSRQTIMIVEGDNVRSRLLSPREAARLMGLSENYKLPENYNEAYHISGDGVAVPVVRFLAAHILEPALEAFAENRKKVA